MLGLVLEAFKVYSLGCLRAFALGCRGFRAFMPSARFPALGTKGFRVQGCRELSGMFGLGLFKAICGPFVFQQDLKA